jgi:hypothetical protein
VQNHGHDLSARIAFKAELRVDNPVKELVLAAGENREGGLPGELCFEMIAPEHSETGIAAAVERWAAPRTRAIGLRPEFPFARLKAWADANDDAILVERREAAPFGIYTLVSFERAVPPVA